VKVLLRKDLFDEERPVCATLMGACNESSTSRISRGYSCRSGIDSRRPPSRDPYVPANNLPRKAAGLGRDCGNSCALRASASALTPLSSWPRWAINALLFDYRLNYRRAAFARQGRLSKNGAIIDHSGPGSERSECRRRMARGMCHRKSRSCGRRLWFEHKRDADAGTFKAIEESAFERALIGLRRELAADLVARTDQQMTLRLSARTVAIGFCC
jgi:hypothetical protein